MNRAASSARRAGWLSLALGSLYVAGTLHAQGTAHHQEQILSGGKQTLREKLSASRRGVSVVVGDLDLDGTPDLVTGYAAGGEGALLVQRGVAGATAPGSAERAALAAEGLVAPFAARAEVIALPVVPELLVAADVTGSGRTDLLAGARGGREVYVLAGHGDGTFGDPRPLALTGSLRALTVWRNAAGENLPAAAVCGGASGCGVQLLAHDGSTAAFIPVKQPVTLLEAAAVNGGSVPDLLAISGSKATLLDGDSLLSGSPRLQTLPVAHAKAVAAGFFVYSFHTGAQLAVLDDDATIHIFQRGPLNPHQLTETERREVRRAHNLPQTARATGEPWTEVETVRNVGNGARDTLLLKGHFSAGGQDDLLVFSAEQTFRLSHPSRLQGDVRLSEPVVTAEAVASPAVAAVAARVSPDSRMGVVSLRRGVEPQIAVPPVAKIYNVGLFTDAAPNAATITACLNNVALACTLRTAVALSNSDASANISSGKIDVINIAAGTYTLNANNGSATDQNGDGNSHLDLDGPVSIVGAGQLSTTINGNATDNIFAINSGVVNALAPFDVFVSNLTLRNGINQNNPSSQPNSVNYIGGLVAWESYGSGYLTFNNVALRNGTVRYGYGGAIATSNSNGPASGTLEVDNSVVSGNSTPEVGGGIATGAYNPMILNTVTVSGNAALVAVSSADPNATGEGGGVATAGGSGSTPDTITGSTISSNSSTVDAGGLLMLNGFLMSGSTVTGNTAGTYAGGLYYLPFHTAASILTSNFLSNTASNGSGGGICYALQNTSALGMTMHFSRVHANKASSGATGLAVGCNASSGNTAVNATDNWWGCNGAATGTGCDTGGTVSGSTLPSSTFSPYTTLIETLSSATPAPNTTITATGSLGQDSAGTPYATSNDAGYFGVPATNVITQGGSSTTSAATTLNSSAAIVTAVNVTTSGSATVTVDGTSVTSAYTATLPTMTSVTLSSSSVQVGSPTQISATVTDQANPSDMAVAGTVTFFDTFNGSTSTLATVTLSGSNVATIMYTPSMAGSHAITANYTPTSGTFYTASTSASQTLTVTPGNPYGAQIVNSAQVGAPLSVKQGQTLGITVIFEFPGTLGPTGAFAASVDSIAVPSTCVTKPKHRNCSISYTGGVGSHTFQFTQAGDANYTALTGSAQITVTQ